ncbi:MAG: hypothetical protein KGJ62_14790 [Armatimonadetes bacterium]|nr:hypothetical protein [Armatimonadota bacterium]
MLAKAWVRFTVKHSWLFCALLAVWSAGSARCQTVASDGAVGINAQWELGKSSTWWIEEQRIGADFITAGVAQENPNLIKEGVVIFHWGFAHQSTNGSFPGTAGGVLGPMYHSTSLFVEAVARAAIALSGYHPVSYTLPAGTYSTDLTYWALHLTRACNWLLRSTVQPNGILYDKPFTHRRWLLAAALGESGVFTGNATFSAAAIPYAEDGLTLQLGPGWRASLLPASNGVVPPAVLVAPGANPPANATSTFSAVGVNPEASGYDVSYQAVGLFYAAAFYTVCSRASLKPEIAGMLEHGLDWERSRTSTGGLVNIVGSTRVGIEKEHDGSLKPMAYATAEQAYALAGEETGLARFAVVDERMITRNRAASAYNPAVDGAMAGNIIWEQGKASSWSIAFQKHGIEWIEAGIADENRTYLDKGMLAFRWAWSHQATDGSFAGTSSPWYSTAEFVEAIAHAALLLQNFHPVTFTPTPGYYAGWAAELAKHAHLATDWMTEPAIENAAWINDAPYTDRRFLVGAAYQQTADASGDSTLNGPAAMFVKDGIARQWANGVWPESGAGDPVIQMQTAAYVEDFLVASADSAINTKTDQSLALAMKWEYPQMDIYGTLKGVSQPPYRLLLGSWQGAAAQTGSALDDVVAARITAWH